MPPRRILAAGALLALTLGSAGCSSSTSSSNDGSASAQSSTSLVLYSAIGYDADMVKAFTAKTGINVKLVDDSTGPLLTKVAAEKDNAQWNVLWVDGDAAMASLDSQGLLQPNTPAASLNAVGKSLVPSDKMWSPTGVTTVMSVVCNPAKVPTVPTSWQSLTGPAFKDKLGMNNPAKSGPTYPFVAGMMQQLGGEDQGKAWFTAMKDNGLKVFDTNGDTLHALETGQIGCGIVQSSAALGEQIKQKGKFDLRITYLDKVTELPSAMTISKPTSGATLDAAKKFEDFVLSPEGQAVAQKADPSGDSLFWPVVDGVSKPASLPEFPQAQHLDPGTWGPKQSEIVTWFTNTIAK